ncbi:TetR/AcrR family transcriptional regulator [Antrihabitans sp. YC2-6]|nr:TetR/AcrR family transcriptional regulator [Antrihabitans sp. YC2-6]
MSCSLGTLDAGVASTVGDGVVKRVDARSSRWFDHRAAVRADIVEAAFRAFDKNGPDAHMDDIAKEAGATKTKLYRHFNDKRDLHDAVARRVKALLWEGVLGSINFESDSIDDIIHTAVSQYAHLVDLHPNVFRYLMRSHFSDRSGGPDPALDDTQQLATLISDHFASALQSSGVSTKGIDMTVRSIVGAGLSATDWWIESQFSRSRALSLDDFIGQLSVIIWGIIDATSRSRNVEFRRHLPLDSSNVRVIDETRSSAEQPVIK